MKTYLCIFRATVHLPPKQFERNLEGEQFEFQFIVGPAYVYNGHVYAKVFVDAQDWVSALEFALRIQNDRLGIELSNIGNEQDRGA